MSYIDELAKFPPFEIEIPGKGRIKIHRKVLDEITRPISAETFVQEAQELPRTMAVVGQWHAFAKAQVDHAHSEYRLWRSHAEVKVRTPPANAKEAGWKKPTDAATESMVRTLDGYKKHQTRIVEAQRAADALGALLDCLVTKRDVLKMLQHEYRQERERAPKTVAIAG